MEGKIRKIVVGVAKAKKYTKVATYAYNTYETMYQSDEAMAAWLLKTMANNQGIEK